jgi:exopolysaccharide biosynthesis polyprenyl glycosylphosphotransferase
VTASNEALLDYAFTDVLDERTRSILERRRASRFVKDRGWLVRRLLVAADIFALLAASLGAQLVAGRPGINLTWLAVSLAAIPGWVLLAKLYGLYDNDQRRPDHSTGDEIVTIIHLVTIGGLVALGVAWLAGLGHPAVGVAATFWGSAVVLMTAGRVTARVVVRRSVASIQNTVIVGAGEVGQAVARKILQHPEYGINIVGFVDRHPKERTAAVEHLTVLGSPEELPHFVSLLDVERVVIAFSGDAHEDTLALVRELQPFGVHIDIVPRLFEVVGPGVGMHAVEGLALVGLPPAQWGRSSLLLKRGLDVAVAGATLLLLAPLLAFFALRVKLDSPGPVLFRQVRMGAGEKIFYLYKFRTMVADADERKDEVAHLNRYAHNGGDTRMFKVENDPRVTNFGRFLRRYFLDELPQLLNVLKGDMSLVGPRPLILEEDQHVDDWRRSRLNLKPGMTGPWQVLGRNTIPFEEMVRLDYLYVTNWSLANDLRLLCRTAPLVLRGGEHL